MATKTVNVDAQVNQKILTFALSQKFTKSDDLAAITEVINATSNPQVAALILLGLYEMPEIKVTERTTIPDNSVYRSNKVVDFKAVLIEYDKFNNKVKFSYEISTAKTRWFLTNSAADKYNETGDYSDGCKTEESDDYTFESTFILDDSGEMSCTLEAWLKE